MNGEYYLEQLEQLPGLEQMKDLVRQWDAVAQNCRVRQSEVPPALPNMFWCAKAGAGKTHCLRLISEYLDAVGLMEFYGDVKYFEFYLEYCKEHEQMHELGRLMDDIKAAAGFRSEFRGVIAIDISAWKESFEQQHFIRVMEYLSSIDDRVLLVFLVENFKENEITKAQKILQSYFRVRSIDFSYPSADDFAVYCLQSLALHQFVLDDEARLLLVGALDELIKAKYFDGYKTVNRLCQEIAFHLFSLPQAELKTVGAAHLLGYSKDSKFIKNLCETIKTRELGFGGANDGT